MRNTRLKVAFVWVAIGMTVVNSSPVSAQTDIGVDFYEAFNRSTAGNGVQQKVSNSPGGMVELRHLQGPWVGYEVTYSLNPEDQSIAPITGNCGFYCSFQPQALTTKAHEVSIDWVAAKKMGNIRPFIVGGLGIMIDVPGTYYQYDLSTSARLGYVYGGGVDWGFGSRVGVRLQYRGNFYKSPDISLDFPPTGRFTHTGEPMIGFYFRL